MSKKHWQTAADFMAELQADPQFQRQQAEKDRKLAEREAAVAAVVRPIMDDLQNAGITAESIEDMTQRYAPLAPQIVQVLLGWLPRVQDDRVKESLIRSLGAAGEPFDGKPLVECFSHDSSDTLRWPIANTMAETRPLGVADWLAEAVKNRSFGNARGMLAVTLARVSPPETSLPVLMSVLDELPGHVATAIGEVGGVAELNALQSRVGDVQGWEKAEFLKAIRKIQSRLREAS